MSIIIIVIITKKCYNLHYVISRKNYIRTMIKNEKSFLVSDSIILCIYYCINRLPNTNTFQGSVFHPGLCCWYGSWVHDSFQSLEINVNEFSLFRSTNLKICGHLIIKDSLLCP